MAKKVSVSQEELDKFDQFLFEMDDVLEPFIEAATSTGYRLDYSLDSLSELERYYVAHQNKEDEGLLFSRCSRYLGEVFRKVVGGQWRLNQKPRSLHFKLPVLTDYSDMNLEYCPTIVFQGFVVRREPGGIRQSVEVSLEYARKRQP